MLKQMKVTNSRGMTLTLEMMENDSGIQIDEIEGLDPVKATLVSTSFANLDGTEFQSSRREARNIKIKLDLEPTFILETYSSLRKKLRTYFIPKQAVTLQFTDVDGLAVDIKGYVEDHSSAMWTEDPNVDISVMCFKPDFIDMRLVTLNGNTVSTVSNTAVDYPGDVEAGTILTLNVNRTMTGFTVYNTSEDGTLSQLDFNQGLIAGDILVVSSVRGAKGIYLTRSGITTSYLYGRTAQSGWVEFREGINQFRVYSPGAAVPYKVEYMVRYGGL